MRAAGGVGIVMLSAWGVYGQTALPTLSFEVASVKVNTSAPEGRGIRRNAITPGPAGVTMISVSLKAAIQWAYHLQSIQVTGPNWVDGDRYDIIAKAAGPVPEDQLRRMVQTLLAQRFKLTYHTETKEMQAYVVTVAKGGHKLKPSEGEGEMDAKPTGKGLTVAFTHVTLAQLSEMAFSPLQGVVVDQTGLKGAWDFTLDPSGFMMVQPTGIEDMIGMVIQAANEQLGIKIEQKKAPAEIFIVDHAERVPVEN